MAGRRQEIRAGEPGVEELWANTDQAPDASTPKPRYDVYFSYSEADKERVEEMSGRLKALDPRFRWFDELELVPGESEIRTRGHALEESGRVAVLLGPSNPTRVAMEEANQAVFHSIENGMPAFFVYLPGSDGPEDEDVGHSWLRSRLAVDLREQFDDDDDGRLTTEGLTRLVAAVRNINIRAAEQWLTQQAAPAAEPSALPPRLRAMVVGIANYQRYPALPSADADLRSVEQLLRSAAEDRWEILRFEKDTEDDLALTAKAFFGTGVGGNDTLLFYFSGHGVVEDEDDLYLVMKTTEPDDIVMTAFPIKALARYVRQSAARRKLVILDCCFSGEAGDTTDWGSGSAVFMTSRQVVTAGSGTSELTRAIMTAWASGADTTGDLLDRLGNVEFRVNREFDRSILLPRTEGGEQWSAADSLPSARLSFNERGDLYVGLSSLATDKGHRVELPSWDDGRQQLVTNLIEMIDAVVSLVPPEKLPMESVRAAFLSLGSDLLRSTLTEAARDKLGRDLDAWNELRLELSFDDRWADRAPWERLPWESLLLCSDSGRPIWLERIVRAKATKSITRRRPSRVIAWNAFTEANPQYSTGAKHLLTHLLREELAQHVRPPKLMVKERALWSDLYQASQFSSVEDRDPQQPAEGEKLRITDFDTFLLFAPVSLLEDEPVVWFPKGAAAESTRASTLVEQLRKWAFSYLIVETVAWPAASLYGTSDLGLSRARSLQATTQLATKLARELGTTVVAVCHLPSFVSLARPVEGDETTFMPSFSGQLLRQLGDSSLTLNAAAQKARRVIVEGLNREDSLEIGLPVVCRPEPELPGPPTVRRAKQPLPTTPRAPGKR